MCTVIRNSEKRHSNADKLSRRVRPHRVGHKREIEFASESTNREQLNAACDTDEQDKVMDYEQTDILEKQVVDPQKQLAELQKPDSDAHQASR